MKKYILFYLRNFTNLFLVVCFIQFINSEKQEKICQWKKRINDLRSWTKCREINFFFSFFCRQFIKILVSFFFFNRRNTIFMLGKKNYHVNTLLYCHAKNVALSSVNWGFIFLNKYKSIRQEKFNCFFLSSNN